MEPVSNTSRFLKVLNEVNYLVQNSPYNNIAITPDDTNRDFFNDGRCVLYYSSAGWIKSIISQQLTNGFAGKLNIAPLSGKKCSKNEKCPFATNGVNYAPYLASGGFAYAVNSRVSQEKQAAALSFALYLADPQSNFWDVAHSDSYLNIHRQRHVDISFENNETREVNAFLDFGWESRQLPMLRETIKNNFFFNNTVLGLRIIGANSYFKYGTMPYLHQMWRGKANASEVKQQLHHCALEAYH